MNDSVAIIIPARYASSRLPGKPLLDIGGKPMIQWVYENSKSVSRADRVIVATDSQMIIDAVEAFGGEAVLTRDDHHSGTDRVAEVASDLNQTIIINVQGDEPFISTGTIDKAIDTIWNNSDLLMGSLVKPANSETEIEDISEAKVVLDKFNNALYFSRSIIPFLIDHPKGKWIDSKIPYFNHVGIYAYRREFLLKLITFPPSPLEQNEHLEQLRVLENGYKIKMNRIEESSLSVDTEEDLARARELVKNH